MLALIYTSSLMLAAVTYAAFALFRALEDNNQYQFARAYCQVRINHHP